MVEIKLKLKPRFFILAILVSFIIAGWFLPTIVVPYLDKAEFIHPLLAAIIYYSFIYIIFALFIYALIGEWTHRALRLSIVLYSIYLMIDWFEPPLIVSPTGEIGHTLGWRSSSDYAIGYTINQFTGWDWATIYWVISILVPATLALIVIIIASPQLLGRALRQVRS